MTTARNSSIKSVDGRPLAPMLSQCPASQSRGSLNFVQDASYEALYQRDLETLDRIERQLEEVDPCFFCAMGEVARERMEAST